MDFHELMRTAQENSRSLAKPKVDRQAQRDKILKNVQKDEILRKKRVENPEEKAERNRKLMERVNKDLSGQHSNDINKTEKPKTSASQANHSSNKSKKQMSDAEVREQRLALQEKARKMLSQPLKKPGSSTETKLSSSAPKKTNDTPSKHPRTSLVPASELGLKPLSQKMEDILSAKNNINYTKRDISGIEKKKHKKKKKEKDREHSKKNLARKFEPVPKQPKIVKHSTRQINMKPVSFEDLLKQANDNKEKTFDWKKLEEEQRKRKDNIEKQKEMDRREKLRMLVPEKSPRKNVKPLVPQESTSRSAVKPAIPHQARNSTVQNRAATTPRVLNQKMPEKRKPRPPSPVPMPKMPRGYGYDDYDDEYDEEMDDFIDDGDINHGGVTGNEIWKIFGKDKRKYNRINDFGDIDNMESSFGQMDAEERRSAKIGRREDLEDIRREEEEKKKKRERLKKMKMK